MRIGCHILQWGMGIDRKKRYTWDGKIWNRSLEQTLDSVSNCNYEGFECNDSDVTPYFNNPGEFRTIVSSRGLKFVSIWNTLLPKKMASDELQTVNPDLPMSDPGQYAPISISNVDERTVQEDLAEKKHFALKLSELGGGMVTIGGPYMVSENIREEYYEMAGHLLNEIAEEYKKYGIKVSYHPELGTIAQNVRGVDLLFDYADKGLVGLCLETAHLTCAGVDPAEFVERYGPRITHAHMKDVSSDGKFVELGTGIVQFGKIIRALKKVGYNGWLMAELDIPVRSADESARANKVFLDALLKE